MSDLGESSNDWTQAVLALGRNHFVTGVNVLPKGHLHIRTALTYPDGGYVAVYIPAKELERKDGRLGLTDFGNTATWLEHLEVDIWEDPVFASLADKVLQGTKAVRVEDTLVMNDLSLDELGLGLIEFAQCCLRVADLGQLEVNLLEEEQSLPSEGNRDFFANFVPVTPLAKKLWALRQELKAHDGTRRTSEEIRKEIRELRGYDD